MMPVLVVDAGNSRLKWKWAGDNSMHAWAYPQQDLTMLVDAHWRELPRPAEVWLSCVVPTVATALAAWIATHWHCPLRQACSAAQAGDLRNGYRVPQQLGVDRWLALVAGRDLQDGAFCVVDCGTAVTCDWVDTHGQHRGGWIMPGLTLMCASLAQRSTLLAAALHHAEPHSATPIADLPRELARDTVSGVTMGTLYAVAAAVDKTLADTQAPCLLTGGDAETVAASLRHRDTRVIPDLVLRGLEKIAQS